MSRLPGLARVALAVAGRPALWTEAVVTGARLAPSDWWRHWPPVPLPDAAYWHFRMITAYGGSGDAIPKARDVIDYLEWCRERRRATGHLR